MFFNLLHVFAVMIWIKIWIFAETSSSSMNTIITDAILPTNLQVCWITRTGLTLRTKETYCALSTGRSCKVILTNANVLRNILMLNSCLAIIDVFDCSLTISMMIALIITKFRLNRHTIMEDRLHVDFFHDFFFNSALVIDLFDLSVDWRDFL